MIMLLRRYKDRNDKQVKPQTVEETVVEETVVEETVEKPAKTTKKK